MKTDNKLLEKRDNQLYCDYISLRHKWNKECRTFTLRELLLYVITHGHPEYHFTYDYARRIIVELMKEEGNTCLRGNKRQLIWYEIRDKVRTYMERHPRRSMNEGIAEVLAFGKASQYFISYEYAKHIINEKTRKISSYHRA